MQGPGRRREWRTPREACEAAGRILADEQVERLLRVAIDREVEEAYRQAGPGRPGPDTEYRRVETVRYRVRFEEDAEALRREARCDGLFPLLTNAEALSLEEALGKYKD